MSLSGCYSIDPKFSSGLDKNKVEVDVKENKKENNIWIHLAKDFTFDTDLDRPEVQKQIQRYIASPEDLLSAAVRGSPYIYYIVDQIKKRNLPVELALLPMIESAYNPYARSVSGALGLWQFLGPTAADYSIKRNWWYDGRRDIIDSTQAALDYLTELNSYFKGDWRLAIAAYNAGKGKIQSAIRYNAHHKLPVDFWHLPLSQETKTYVSKFLALCSILKYNSRYAINWPNTPDKPYFSFIMVDTQINLLKVAKLAEINTTEFYTLNPGFNRSITSPHSTHTILIPADKAEQFKLRWVKLVKNEIKPAVYKIQTNHLLTDSLHNSKKIIYFVKWGDTLSAIAQHYKVSITSLLNWNALSLETPLQIGQRLIMYLRYFG